MAYYRFLGDPLHGREGPPVVTVFGHRFEMGEPVKIEDSAVCKKLDGNGHFEKIDGRSTAPRPKPKPRRGAGKAKAAAAVANTAEDTAQDGINDGDADQG